MENFNWYVTFHGGKDKGEVNDILSYSEQGNKNDPYSLLDLSTIPKSLELDELRGMTWGPDNNLYVANAHKSDSQILQFDGQIQANGQYAYLSTFVSEPGAHPFQGIFGPDGNLYVANQDTLNVTRYQGPSGSSPGSPIDGGVFASGFSSVRGIAFDHDGNLYIVDEDASQISIWGSRGNLLGYVPDPDEHLNEPIHIIFHNHILYIGNKGKENILCYDGANSNEVEVLIHKGDAELDGPAGLCFAPDGLLYVASRKAQQINSYSLSSDGQTATFNSVFISDLPDDPEFIMAVSSGS